VRLALFHICVSIDAIVFLLLNPPRAYPKHFLREKVIRLTTPNRRPIVWINPKKSLTTGIALPSMSRNVSQTAVLVVGAAPTGLLLAAGSNVPDFIGQLDPAAAFQLGMEASTLLAIRPDGYIGLRCARDHLAALQRYATSLAGMVDARAIQ
jgi:hypothetical protein